MELAIVGEGYRIDKITAPDEAIVALNNAHARELSWIDQPALQRMIGQAFSATRIGELDAFILAFDQNAPYDNPNFRWFSQRFPRFVYVDRVVVAPHASRRGYARALYERLFAQAIQAGHSKIVCEINADPPNPASDAFHTSLGFLPVGTALLAYANKTVRYMELPLPDGP